MIKIATYNLNNLFERVKVMDLEGFSKEAQIILDDVKRINELLSYEDYNEVKDEIIALLTKYFLRKKNNKYTTKLNEWFQIVEVRGKLYKLKRDGSGIELTVKGRRDWNGWVELTKGKTNGESVVNTARVLNAVKADIVCTVEVDNRITLKNFSELMRNNFQFGYKNSMLIDGNDNRGIDVGLLTNFEIGKVYSHINDRYLDSHKREQNVFSRDCAEYEIILPNKQVLYVLCNHFKSKGYGNPVSNDNKRKLQVDHVVQILSKYDLKKDYVVVAGDFNDTPERIPLQRLLQLPNLNDVFKAPQFKDQPTWTYHTGNQQIDYLLVSEPLFHKIHDVGVERRGIFRKGNKYFPEVTSKANQASDHACVWATFDV